MDPIRGVYRLCPIETPQVPRSLGWDLSSLVSGPAFALTLHPAGNSGTRRLASLAGRGCVVCSLKSHPCEVIAHCCPEHLPKITLTSACPREGSWLGNRKEPDPGAAFLFVCDLAGEGDSVRGTCVCSWNVYSPSTSTQDATLFRSGWVRGTDITAPEPLPAAPQSAALTSALPLPGQAWLPRNSASCRKNSTALAFGSIEQILRSSVLISVLFFFKIRCIAF